MGTEVHCKNSFYSMRNVNENSNGDSWHLFYGDNAFTNTHYYNNFNPRTLTDPYIAHERDELKQKMLQHEAIFKNQVYQLHRLYRRQRDMMEEAKRKEFNKYQNPIDTSSSSSFMPPQKPYEGAQKWQNSRPSIFGVDISNSPISCSKGNDSKDCEIIDCRPSKVRKKLFDLQLPAYEYIEPEDGEQDIDNQASEISSYHKEPYFLPKNGVTTFLENGYRNTSSGQHCMRSNGLTDLNEPVYIEAKPAAFNHFHGKEVHHHHQGTYSEISSKFQDYSRFNQTPSIFTSSNAYPSVTTSDSLSRKLQKYPLFVSSPTGHHEGFGDKWHRNGYYGNRLFHASSSGSKEQFDYQNCKKIDDGSQKFFKGSNFIDLTDTKKGMDLNTIQTLSDDEDDSRKCDQTVLPWLKSKPNICKKDDVSKEKDNKKLLGFPIFGNFCKNDASSSVVSTSASIKKRGIDINVAWDDVTACENIDEKRIDGEEIDVEIKNFKNHFDLNSCVTEDDLLVTESVKSSKKKMTIEIDLEAPAVSELEEEEEEEAIQCGKEHEKTVELEKIAVEAIVEISSQQDQVGPAKNDDPLLWFVEVVEKNTVFVNRETDEYEMLTLQMEESKEEDYMPTPLVPDVQEPDEVGPALTNRPRRGQARRGRPRRDFQRDILPGMESLSRHEISEDLHIFGGLMKATGHSWNFGTMKRNGKKVGVWGRRKGKAVEITSAAAAPPPPPPAVVGLEERSFTGWGKTTRRPRRQRCGVGNSVVVQST